MATYLKRTSKFDFSLSQSFTNVNLRDLMCPVCRGILIEPVTLPCTHNLCLRCLKGTFEHNSLSCPLCRVRVGSWLRTATKSETLVNNGLWEFIQAKFPKEVEDKHNGDDGDIELDSDFTAANKILSAAGEIRREYEAQLQMAEEEIRRQRKADEIASEALIRKIQAEEEEQLAQLAQDELLATTLAKKQIAEKRKEVTKYYNECLHVSMRNCPQETSKYNTKQILINNMELSQVSNQNLEQASTNVLELKDSLETRKSNSILMSNAHTELYSVSGIKANISNALYKDSSISFCYQKSVPTYNAITRTLKHQPVTKFTQPSTSNHSVELSCSTSKIYGSQSEEELHVPSDILNSKKKSLGVEVCTMVGDNDERIGSAESAESHDSINQEIHHFKPIKAIPRTPLKISADGKQIDPKLIRVLPILKRVSNVVPTRPSPMHLKKIIGCSWSAFRGKARQDLKVKENLVNATNTENNIEEQPSTSVSQEILNESRQLQGQSAAHTLDIDLNVSLKNVNKNNAKNVNRLVNGTRASKRLILDEPIDSAKIQKSWKTHLRNGMITKSKKQRGIWTPKKEVSAETVKDADDNSARSYASPAFVKQRMQKDDEHRDYSDDVAVENIAERIKRRKENVDKKNSQNAQSTRSEHSEVTKRKRRKGVLSGEGDNSLASDENATVAKKAVRTRFPKVSVPRTKRQKSRRLTRSNVESPEKSDSSVDVSCKPIASGLRKSANVKSRRHSLKSTDSGVTNKKIGDEHSYSFSKMCAKKPATYVSESNSADNSGVNVEKTELSDVDIIKEQERIERLVRQEKEDFELAQRLQAKFDEMERVAGRTRQARRAIENSNAELTLYKVKVKGTVRKASAAHTAKQASINRSTTSEPKQRGRPRKRVK